MSVVVEFASPCGVGPADGNRAFFLKCNKLYQGAGHAAVEFGDPAPWQALQQWAVGRWMGVGEGGLGWATPVGAAVTPFLINGSWVHHLPLLRAGLCCLAGGKQGGWSQSLCWLGAGVPRGNPEGWTDLPTSSYPSTPQAAH